MSSHELSPDGYTVARTCVSNQCRGKRRGSTHIITLVALPVLLGIGALAIDLALMGLAGQRVQNVSDTAALAGAVKAADAAGAITAADQTTTSNNEFSTWQVDGTTTTYGPGQQVPGFRTLGYREHVTEVVGTTDFQFLFARLFGLEQATITRDSAAMCDVWRNRLAEGFIFAGSTDPAIYGVYSDGLGNNFNGSMHSNTSMCLNGADNVVTGDIRYRNAFAQNGPGFTHDGDLIETATTAYPVDFTWEDFDTGSWDHEVAHINEGGTGASLPGGRWHVNGDMTITSDYFECRDALFVVEGNIYIDGTAPTLDGVTLVARGDVTFIGADGSFSPYQHDLFAFSTQSSSSDVMSIDGARCDAEGVLFAPNGGLYWEGSAETSYRVGLVADHVTLIGSFCTHEGPASALVCDQTSSPRLVR